jgi:hypothetical protein
MTPSFPRNGVSGLTREVRGSWIMIGNNDVRSRYIGCQLFPSPALIGYPFVLLGVR